MYAVTTPSCEQPPSDLWLRRQDHALKRFPERDPRSVGGGHCRSNHIASHGQPVEGRRFFSCPINQSTRQVFLRPCLHTLQVAKVMTEGVSHISADYPLQLCGAQLDRRG